MADDARAGPESAEGEGGSEIRKVYQAGENIFVEGERGDHAFIVERGRVEITFLRQGRSVRIAILGQGEIFGEMALIDDRERSATATALVPTEVVVVRREQIHGAMRGADPTMRLLLDVLLGRFRAMQGRMDWVIGEDGQPQPDGGGDAAGDETHSEAIERLKFQQELKQAVADQAFRLLLQPIVGMGDGFVQGFEALIRWEKGNKSGATPGQFISVAEATDIIQDIDRWMCRQAIGTAAALRDKLSGTGRPVPYVSVNLSGLSLADDSVIESIGVELKAKGLPPSALRVEITEGVLIDNPKKVAVVLDQFQGAGIRVAVDDFGTGYSSLGYLVGFPINTLKVDRVFVNNMLSNDSSLEIVRAIVGMAHALNMDVVAEGVETTEELQALWRMGCEHAQGFLLSRPCSPEDALAFAARGPALSTGPVVIGY